MTREYILEHYTTTSSESAYSSFEKSWRKNINNGLQLICHMVVPHDDPALGDYFIVASWIRDTQ